MADLSQLQHEKSVLERERDSIVSAIHELRERARKVSIEAGITRRHVAEALQDNKRKALQDPFWNDLFVYKKAEGDDTFFAQVPILIHQTPYAFHQGKRLSAVLRDVAAIPLRYWKYSAAVIYLEEVLARMDRHALAPSYLDS